MSSPGPFVQHSLSKTLTIITGLLVVVLVSVFAIFATTAFERQQDANRILSIVTVKRDMLSAQQALRVEGGSLDLAVERAAPASAATIAEIAAMHERTRATFAHLKAHATGQFTSGYAEILELEARYERLMPALLDTIAKPLDQRSPAVLKGRLDNVLPLFAQMKAKSNSLSRSIAYNAPLINEMLRVNDIAWQARSDAGFGRHDIMRAILAGGTAGPKALQGFARSRAVSPQPGSSCRMIPACPNFRRR